MLKSLLMHKFLINIKHFLFVKMFLENCTSENCSIAIFITKVNPNLIEYFNINAFLQFYITIIFRVPINFLWVYIENTSKQTQI